MSHGKCGRFNILTFAVFQRDIIIILLYYVHTILRIIITIRKLESRRIFRHIIIISI